MPALLLAVFHSNIKDSVIQESSLYITKIKALLQPIL